MAAALCATDKKENFQRLAGLLMCGGVTLLREVFDAIHPPASLSVKLSDPATKTQLKGAKLTKPQWDCVYPSPGMCGKSTDFDITLLFRLLRTICYLTPPATGWDKLPINADHSREADLARIKYYRNSVYGHNHTMEITDTDFASLWREISEALLRIAGTISSAKRDEWKESIDKLLHDPLTPDVERYVAELQSWYKKDMDTKGEVEKLRNEMEQMTIKQEQMNIEQEQTHLAMKIMAERLKAIESAISHTAGQHTSTAHDFWHVVYSFRKSIEVLFKYLRIKLGVDVQDSRLGSLVITVSCSSMDVLEGLWIDYCSGHLNEVVQETIVTKEVLEELGLSEVKLKTIISDTEYKACKKFLKQKSGHTIKKEKEKEIKEICHSALPTRVKPAELERTYVKHSEIPEGADYTAAPGYFMMINNYSFPKKQRYYEETTALELARLQHLFVFEFGFRSREYENLTKSEMLNELTQTAEKDFSKYDCFVCVILSDGSKDGIFGSDDEVINPETITSLFTRDKCPSLDGKPKIFLIETFRRRQSDEGPPLRPVISEDDFLIWYAPLISGRDFLYFPTPLSFVADSLEDHSSEKHLMDILMRANEGAESEFPYPPPYLVSTLTKKVFFKSK